MKVLIALTKPLLFARGIITQTEAANFLRESKQAFGYRARGIDRKEARTKLVSEIIQSEILKAPRGRKRRSRSETA